MKELTSAQGTLRCGECNNTFDAMEALSSTLPENNKFTPEPEKKTQNIDQTNKQTDDIAAQSTLTRAKTDFKDKTTRRNKHHTPAQDKAHKYILMAIAGLVSLLLIQVLYSNRDWFARQPLTAGITHAFCKAAGCKISPRREPSQIEVISRNVYGHPNEPKALIISASIANRASFDQPYPLVEVSFLDSAGNTVALRRFPPREYLSKDKTSTLFNVDETVTFRIKISDPGKNAVTFQFRFL
jgi:hypothetical protein